MAGLLNGNKAGIDSMQRGNDPLVLAAAERAHKDAVQKSIDTIATGDIPLPRPDTRAVRYLRNNPFPPPPEAGFTERGVRATRSPRGGSESTAESILSILGRK